MDDQLQPVYLLTGGDRPKIARALARLRGRVGEDAVEQLAAGEASGDDAAAACNALGLFSGGRRLVVVSEVERWKSADVKAVAAYLSDPAPETVLALVGSGVKRESPLAKACAKAGRLLVYDVSKRELPRWVAEQFARHGVQVDLEVCRALVELAGEDAEALASETHKLAVWADGGPIDRSALEALVVPLGETPGFALTDAWGRRDLPATLAAAESILERAPGARSGALARLAGLFASHVARVRECQRLAADGVRPRDAASRMKRSPFYVEKLYAQAQNFSTDELRAAVERLAEVDLALKGGSRLPGDLELERALVDVTQPG